MNLNYLLTNATRTHSVVFVCLHDDKQTCENNERKRKDKTCTNLER